MSKADLASLGDRTGGEASELDDSESFFKSMVPLDVEVETDAEVEHDIGLLLWNGWGMYTERCTEGKIGMKGDLDV